jgi:small ligand-binding sensory domain FIST
MGVTLEKQDKVTVIPPEYTSTYPMILHRSTGDPIIRPVLMLNYENGSVMSNGLVEQGSKVQLSLPPDFEIIDEVVNDCKEVQSNELQEADALIMFSCVGRLSALGPLISDEIEGVKNTFNVPLAGFFSYGEFGRATNGNHEYHNLTCCWVALKEKEI